MQRETNRLFARRYLDRATAEDYIDWAVAAIVEGWSSDGLNILAGLSKPFNSLEVQTYFQRALDELRHPIPEETPALHCYADDIAEAIVEGRMSPSRGCRELYHLALEPACSEKLARWVDLDEQLEPETYREIEDAEWEEAVVEEARRLLQPVQAAAGASIAFDRQVVTSTEVKPDASGS